MSTEQLSNNLWKSSSAKLDGPSKLNSRLVKPQSFAALPPETPAEANFIRNKGPVDSESWKKSFPPKPNFPNSSAAPKHLPANPLSSMVPSDLPGHPVLSSGKPNHAFYANQSGQLKNVLASAPQSSIKRSKPFSPKELSQLKQANPLAYDRYAALPPKQQQGVLSFGPMKDMTMLIPKSSNSKKSAAPSRFMPRVDPNQFEEIFSAKQPPVGNPKAIGTRQAGDNWYMFGTEVGEGIQKPASPGKRTFGRGDEAATWFAPESYAEGALPGKPGPGMGTKNVIDDVQGIMEGPWKNYLQGPSMGEGEHGVQAVHGSPDGNDFQTFMGQFDKAKGLLTSLQSAAKSIQSLADLAGLAESLGQFGDLLGDLKKFSIPSSPGEMITSLLKSKGLLGPQASKKDVTATAAGGADGIVVTIGGAGAEADGKALMAQIGKNESGSGSQSQGDGSDKSVSKESTGGDVDLDSEAKKSEASSEESETDNNPIDDNDSDSKKESELEDEDSGSDSEDSLAKNENQIPGNLSLEDAQQGSEIAYDGEEGDLTPNGKWKIAEVYEDNAGMRAVLLEPTDSDENRKILAYAGTTLEPFNDPVDTAADLVTDAEQAAGFVPAQYRHAEQLARELKEKHGSDLVLTGHSLGGGQANYAGAMNDIPGVGINSAPLGAGTQSNINRVNPGGADQFVHYNNRFDPISHPNSPGEQLGEIYTIDADYGFYGYGIEDHKIGNVDHNNRVTLGGPDSVQRLTSTPPYTPSVNPSDVPSSMLEKPGQTNNAKPGQFTVDPNTGRVTHG